MPWDGEVNTAQTTRVFGSSMVQLYCITTFVNMLLAYRYTVFEYVLLMSVRSTNDYWRCV